MTKGHTEPMSRSRHMLTIVVTGAACALLALGGCAGSPDGSATTSPTALSAAPSSAQASATPSASLRPAAGAVLPSAFDGWQADAAPTARPTEIDSSQATLSTAIYQGPQSQGSRIVTLVVTDDKGYAAAQVKALTDTSVSTHSVCGSLPQIENSVSCVAEMSGGLLQTTATGTDLAPLAQFTDALYASLNN